MLPSSGAKSCWSPCASKATNIALEWNDDRFLFAWCQPSSATGDLLLATEDGRRVVKYSVNLIILDGWCWHDTVGILRKTSEHPWTASHLRMHLIMRQDGSHPNQAQVINLSKICNTSPALVRRDSTFVETMKALINYARASDLEYSVSLVDARIKHIVHDTLSSEYLPTTTQETHVRHIRFATRCINDSVLLTLLDKMGTKGGTGKNLGIWHLDCSVL